MSSEFQMAKPDIKQIRYLLLASTVFLVMFVPFFVAFARSIPLWRHAPGNLFFAVATTCLLLSLIAAAVWYWMLFSIHTRSVKFEGGIVCVERSFTPDIEIPPCFRGKARAVAVPSFHEPGYQRGTLYWLGLSSFYLPDNFPDAHQVSNELRSRHEIGA
jgi:hypothetical protein